MNWKSEVHSDALMSLLVLPCLAWLSWNFSYSQRQRRLVCFNILTDCVLLKWWLVNSSKITFWWPVWRMTPHDNCFIWKTFYQGSLCWKLQKNHLLIGVLKYEAEFYCLVFPEVFFTQQDFRPLSPRLQLIENKSLQTLKTNNLIKYWRVSSTDSYWQVQNKWYLQQFLNFWPFLCLKW